MRFQVFFKQMGASQAVLDYAEEKLRDRLGRYVLSLGDVHLTFAVEGDDSVAICYFVGEGHPIHAVERAPTMYAAIDGLADKLDAAMRRIKEKRHEHRMRGFVPGESAEIAEGAELRAAAGTW